MNQFEHLIPQNILDAMALDLFQLRIDLISTSAGGLWPEIQVCIDEQPIWSGYVSQTQRVEYSTTGRRNQTLILTIKLMNKTNDHTKINENGDIIENTSVTIHSLQVNQVELIATNLIQKFGDYQMMLDDEKMQYFIKQGYNTGSSHSTTMYENGHWALKFEFPILPYLCSKTTQHEPHEKWPDDKLMQVLYNKILELEHFTQTTRN